MATEAQKRANKKYDKANIKGVYIKLNMNTDSDIIGYLGDLPNVQGHIKVLLRREMLRTRLVKKN